MIQDKGLSFRKKFNLLYAVLGNLLLAGTFLLAADLPFIHYKLNFFSVKMGYQILALEVISVLLLGGYKFFWETMIDLCDDSWKADKKKLLAKENDKDNKRYFYIVLTVITLAFAYSIDSAYIFIFFLLSCLTKNYAAKDPASRKKYLFSAATAVLTAIIMLLLIFFFVFMASIIIHPELLLAGDSGSEPDVFPPQIIFLGAFIYFTVLAVCDIVFLNRKIEKKILKENI